MRTSKLTFIRARSVSRTFAAALSAVVVATVGLVLAFPSAASATSTYPDCVNNPQNGVCYFYRDGYVGADVVINDWDVYDVESPWVTFRGTYVGTAGLGLGVGNATGSFYNSSYAACVYIYEHKGYTGRYNYMFHGSGLTVANTGSAFYVRNNNRSQYKFGC